MKLFSGTIKSLLAHTLMIGAPFVFFLWLSTPQAHAALPSGFEIQTVASGFNLPTAAAFTPDGRIFIAEKDGTVRVFKNGALLAEPLVRLSDVNTYGDRGLLGVALDPNFSQNGYLYLSYTYENSPGVNFAGVKTGRVVRLTVVGDSASEASKVVILGTVDGNVNSPSCDNFPMGSDCIPSDGASHSVGALRFGPDGKLYAAFGDAAAFDYADPRALRAQNLDSLAGKIVRINTDGTAPADNPFYNGNQNANRSKVFVLGVRNSFRFNFRPSNGALLAGDVGWSTWEEVNLGIPGRNFGWPCREGGEATPGGLGCTPSSTPTDPLYFYAHDATGAGSVIGGTFPTGSAYPSEFSNSYFFGDFAQNFIKRMELDGSNQVVAIHDFAGGADGADGPVDFVTGPDGNIYYLAIYTGELKRITYTLGNRQPIAVVSAAPTSGLAPLAVSFQGSLSSDPDGNSLSFSWNFGDGNMSALANPTHTYTTNGTYTAYLTVTDGQGGISTKSLSITVGNQAPTVSIVSPSSGTLYNPGQSMALQATGTDPETGALPGSAYTWKVILHHNVHTHLLQTLTGPNPSFVPPDHGDPDVYVEVELTGTDAAGLTDKASINLYLNNGAGSGGNLVPNPSLEEADPNNSNLPKDWIKGGYGVNNPIFSYPDVGYDGAGLRGAKLNLTSYTDGDAKWFFAPVYVVGGETYHASHYYRSNTTSHVSVQIGLDNGTYTYLDFGNQNASADWKKFEAQFTVPENARTVTVFHALRMVGELSIDTFDFRTHQDDLISPIVSLTNPVSGQILSGAALLEATATDNTGVASVEFLIDSTVVGSDTSLPYQATVATETLSNGTHTITARATDTAGNQATSAPVSVEVNNVALPPGTPNLIANPSVETPSPTPTLPEGWKTGKYGTNQVTFTYPVAGHTSDRGIKINMTSRTSGDAKWYFNDVSVVAGKRYRVSHFYKASVTTAIAARYQMGDGSYQYPTIVSSVPAASDWTETVQEITVPAGAVKMTLFHVIKAVGTLETDDFSLNLIDSTAPAVSLTAPTEGESVSGTYQFTSAISDDVAPFSATLLIDGITRGSSTSAPFTISFDTSILSNGTHSAVIRATDTSGNSADSAPVSFTKGGASSGGQNLITNGSFETENGTNPLGWVPGGWGTHTTTYSYPVAGRNGGKAASFTTTNYLSGDMKWVFDKVAVTPGTIYRYSDWYKSNTISDLIGQYTLSDGSFHYFGLVKEIEPVADWTEVTNTFTPPVGVTHVTFFHLTSANGFLTLDDARLEIVGSGPPATDLTPPVVSITAPLNGATVSGTVNIVADSTDNVGVTYVQFAIDGNLLGGPDTTAPYSINWDTSAVQNGAHTIKATTHDAAGNNTFATVSVTVDHSITPPPTDTTPPTVSITAPSEGATVSGTFSLAIDATDAGGVASVHASIDGATVGSDATAPYQFDIDSTAFVNGAHTITAYATDVAGNIGNATAKNITINNVTNPTPNLIVNPSVETASATDPSRPENWNRGSWGENAAVFSYPDAGNHGARGARVEISNYVSGDAKWFFDPVTVNSEGTYTFTEEYRSNAPTTLTARFSYADGSVQYRDIMTLPASENWIGNETSIIVPVGAISLTVFHHLNTNGFLQIDNYHLVAVGGGTPPPNSEFFTEGMVTLSFDDGWISHITNAAPILNTVNLKGSFYIITNEMNGSLPDNRIANPSLETPDAGNPNVPDKWEAGWWGDHTQIFTYPVPGVSGSAARVEVSNYVSGDAKWVFDDATVIGNQTYTFRDRYQSNATTLLVARFTYNDSSIGYQYLGEVPASPDAWGEVSKDILMPANLQSVTIFHLLASNGFLTIDDADLNRVPPFANPGQVAALQAAGHEVSSHTRSHPYLTTLASGDAQTEISQSRTDLLNIGMTPVDTFVYPYGDFNASVMQMVKDAGYIAARGTAPGFNKRTTDKYNLVIQQVDQTTTMSQFQVWVDTARTNKEWLILMYHQIDGSGQSLSITPALFQEMVNFLVAQQVNVVTLRQGVLQMAP